MKEESPLTIEMLLDQIIDLNIIQIAYSNDFTCCSRVGSYHYSKKIITIV
jgi:hypothetical protein